MKILVAHPSPVVGTGLAELLRGAAGLDAEAEYTPPGCLAETYGEARPEVVVLDLSRETLPALRDVDGARIVVLVHPDQGGLAAAARAGVRNFACYDSGSDEFVMAVANAAERKAYLPASVAFGLLAGPDALPDGSARALGSQPGKRLLLTPEEDRLLSLMLDGCSTHAIGQALGLSDRTIARRLRSLYTKLDASDRVSAIRHAVELMPACYNV